MTEERTVLVAVDFEPTSLEVARAGVRLARRLGAEPWLMHVLAVPIALQDGALMQETPVTFLATAKQALAELAGFLGADPERVVVCEGDPTEEILRQVELLQPKLVVMGTHGRSGLGRLLLGSVSDSVGDRSAVPVLRVNPKAAAAGEVPAPHETSEHREVRAASAIGAVAGAAVGAMGGPTGIAIGAALGATAGGAAGWALEADSEERRRLDEELDKVIGVIDGSIGEAPGNQPPTRGLYSLASVGLGASARETPSDGPMQNIDE